MSFCGLTSAEAVSFRKKLREHCARRLVVVIYPEVRTLKRAACGAFDRMHAIHNYILYQLLHATLHTVPFAEDLELQRGALLYTIIVSEQD